MPFDPRALNESLIQKLNAFLQTQNFPELYKAYAWRNDTYANDFPDISYLESHLVGMDQTSGITLAGVKCVAEWGAMPNLSRIVGKDVVLEPYSLRNAEGFPVPVLGDAPVAPLTALSENITKGVGPTYLSKVLRFGLPQEYGAIDTRCVRVFGQGDAGACRHNWLALYVRYGNRWYIPKAQSEWPKEYGTWINILRYFSRALPDNCPHPPGFVAAGLRQSGVWGCADVEMALFSYASQFTLRRNCARKATKKERVR